MKIQALAPFYDVEAKVDRKRGDVWEVTAARLKAINAAGFGNLAEAVEAEEKPAKSAPKAKKD